MAGVVAGFLTSAAVELARDKLKSVIEEQANLVWNFSDDLEYMKDTMESMAAVMKDAEKQSVTKETVRLWLKRLKFTAQDISNMMDDYQDTAGTRLTAKIPRLLSSFASAPKKVALAYQMRNMREKLREINEQGWAFNFTQSTTTSQDQQHYDERETTSDVKEAEIFGRDSEKKEIIHILTRDAEKKEIIDLLTSHRRHGTMIIHIYGLGGIGKTTLAQHVYNDTKLQQYEHRVWVYVSEVFDLKKIGRSIISQLPIDGVHQNLDNLQIINQCLDKLLPGKKILIILDDLWQEEALELDKLKCMLHWGKKGSMVDVLVTTRSGSIANKICTNKSYKLQPLSDNHCWEIIKQYSGFKDKCNKKKLEEIGLDIAKKCGGVALAAKTLGYTLKSKDLNGWSEINNSDIWNESFGVDSEHKKVLPSLKLSYERMLPMLRLCFSYCAIFLKGQDIFANDLVHQWLALDFIKKSSEGIEYINYLLGMSFLQHSKLSTISREDMKRYTMHDLVHDLARSIAVDELMVIDFAREVTKCGQKCCQYALLINYDGQTNLSDILDEKVKALHFSCSSKLDGSFSFAKCLRVLHFSRCPGILLPPSIGQSKQLKCLIAPESQDKIVPNSIVQLSKLQYLNLRGSSQISTLPESIGKLSCLIYLGLSRCSGVLKLPNSFCDLKNLVNLDMSNCFGITDLPDWLGMLNKLEHLDLSRCRGLKGIPESLGGLHQLQHLNLSHCISISLLPEAIGSLKNLQYLNLKNSPQIRELPGSFQNLQTLVHLDLSYCSCVKGLPQALLGLTSLEHLNMSSFDFGNSFKKDVYDAIGSLRNLKYLNLDQARSSPVDQAQSSPVDQAQSSPDFIGNLTNLEHLVLSGNQDIVSLPECIGNLEKLHTLDLAFCCNLKSLPDTMGKLKRLHTLVITGCLKLNSIPDSISEITLLKSLLIDYCSDELIELVSSKFHPSVTLPLFKVRDDVLNACSNLPLLKYTNEVELRIRSLENVRSLEEAREVKLSDKEKLSDLKLMWTCSDDADRFVDDEDLLGQLVPPTGLKRLKLKRYRGQSFPNWFMDISHHLPNLVSISLNTLPGCNNLPPLGQLPNLKLLLLFKCKSVTKIGKDICGGKGAFRRLEIFTVQCMEGLEEWCTTYSFEDGVEEFMFPVLQRLILTSCPRLRLTRCTIQGSNEIISSLEEPGNSISHLTHTVGMLSCDFKDLRLFHTFTAIEELEIRDCDNLTGFPESMWHFKSLQSLSLYSQRVPALPLPEWLGDLSSLEHLTIEGYRSIKSLPPCISKLTKLRTLRIEENPELKRWCESEENKEKLAHIKDISYWLCD